MKARRLEDEIVKQVKKWVKKGNHIYSTSFPDPAIRFDLRGQAMGGAQVGEDDTSFSTLFWIMNADEVTFDDPDETEDQRPFWGLKFNVTLAEYSKRNRQFVCKEAVPHEVAHLFASTFYPDSKPHGKEWKQVMQDFGLNPSVRGHYDVPERKIETFAYVCGCQEHELTRIRHNKVKQGRTKYTCKDCGEKLRLKGIANKEVKDEE